MTLSRNPSIPAGHEAQRAELTPRGEVRLFASPNSWIEGSAVTQLEKTASLPGMRLAAGLPDLHPGKVAPIGGAFVSDGWIYPTLVGNDIGCGIALYRTGLDGRKPKREAWANKLRHLDRPWSGDAARFLADRGIAKTGFEDALGTIGGGNHFAELQAVEAIVDAARCEELGITPDSAYLCVHSGSRGLGEAILRMHTDRYGAAGLPTGSWDHYLMRHDDAIRWAEANRELIADRIFEQLDTRGTRITSICHNWVERREVEGRDSWIHRKGAAPSTQGPVLVPGSRGAFSYLMMPLPGAARAAYSLAHGAGRKWSRTECRGKLEGRFTVKDLQRTQLGSHVICEDRELLYEEAPQAYKNITSVIEDLIRHGLAQPIAILRPLVTYKVRR